MTTNLFWDYGFLVSSLIYGYLTFHMYEKYQEAKLEPSEWLLSFCAIMSVGMFMSFISYVISSSVSDPEIMTFLLSQILSSAAIATLFSLGLVIGEKKNFLFFPFGFALIQIIVKVFVFLSEINIQLITFIDINILDSILTKLGYIIMVVPIIILFFYLYLKTGSDKSLGFSLGMLLTLVAGFSIAFSYDLSGVLWVFASLVVLFGMKGYYKPILAKIKS